MHGYKDALNVIHESGSKLSVSEETILRLHKLTRGEIWDAGQFKDRNGDIIERYANGRSRVRFKPIAASQTPEALRELLRSYERCTLEQWVHPIVALAAFNLDFLCIHPFRDGNGRVSRLLLLLQCYHHSLEVGRYISLERLIEQNKERYYETLELSSQQWHQGKHDPWQYINVVLYTLKVAYYEFESRVGQTREVQRARRRNWSLRQSKIHRHSFARRTYN